MKNKRLFWIIGILVAILLVGVVMKSRNRSDAERIYSAEAKPRTIIEVVSANGKVQPETEVKMSADVSGEVIELMVKEGQLVKAGEFLAKINPDLTLAALQRAEASLNTQRANLANAKARLAQSKSRLINEEASFKRSSTLFSQGAISQADMDAAKATFEVAKAEVDAAEESVNGSQFSVRSGEATLKEANDQLTRTSIFAPMDGTISLLGIEQGERVVGTAQMAGTEIMRIADLTRMEVNVEVNENDIVRVSVGDPVEIEVDAYLDRTFKGHVTEIANTALGDPTNIDQVTTFNVLIHIERSSYEDLVDPERPYLSPFRPGMSATVEIETERVEEALTIPIQAVTVREKNSEKNRYKDKPWKKRKKAKGDEEEESKVDNPAKKAEAEDEEEEEPEECVFLWIDGIAEKRLVTTGVQDNKYIQILEGLKAGEEVIAGPYTVIAKKLENGDEVERVRKSELYGDTDDN